MLAKISVFLSYFVSSRYRFLQECARVPANVGVWAGAVSVRVQL